MDKVLIYGKPINECSREELEKFAEYAVARLTEEDSPQVIRAKAIGLVRMARDGEFKEGDSFPLLR